MSHSTLSCADLPVRAGAALKRVAIIGADFVPSSLPPALRIKFFATHLRDFGWEPVVVTTDPHYYENRVDLENAGLLPDGLRVIRTAACPARLTRRFGIGDLGMRSLWHHWQALKNLCREQPVDLILIPTPPYVPMVLGRWAYREFGIPYVIDYIDPWGTPYYWKLPRAQRPPKWAMASAMARVLEPFALRHVAHVVGVSKGTTDFVVGKYPWLHSSDATEIPYGGEPRDWEYIRRHPRSNPIFDPADGLLHVSYVGRGGADMVPALRTVLAAVKNGLQASPEVFERLRLHFVGTAYGPDGLGREQVMPLAREIGVETVVQEHPGRVAYLDAMQVLSDSHTLLVVGSEQPHYTASKIFPCILACKPLLAVFHGASSVVSILRETGAADPVTFSEHDPLSGKIEEITERLRQLLLLPPGLRPATRWEAFEAYTARAMTARLAGVFDQVVARHAPAESGRILLAYPSDARR
jgi:hypothetical protein